MAQQSAQSRSTGQIVQHTAVVLAGMASIGLTVAAGTYIVNHIGGNGLPAVIGSGDRGDSIAVTPEPDRSEVPAAPTPGSWGLAAESRQLPVEFTGPVTVPYRGESVTVPEAPASTHSDTSRPRGIGGRVNLTDEAFVGANLTRTQQNSLTLTFDTNVPAALSANGEPRRADDPKVTEFRTDVDVRSGEVSLAVTDPVLGRHDLQVQRHARPAQIPDTERPTAAYDSAVA